MSQMDMDAVLKELDDLVKRSVTLLGECDGYVTRKPTKRVKRNFTPVSIQPRSANRKLSPQRVELVGKLKRNVPLGPYVTSTFVSIQATCPDSCAFKENGCYATSGITVALMRNLDSHSEGWTALEVMREEARLIDGKRGVKDGGRHGDEGRDIRLHVGGEVSCDEGARILAGAVGRYRDRGGGVVWTYTHRWRDIPRTDWEEIQVLASCDTEADIVDAREQGYVPAFVVERFKSNKVFDVAGTTFVPCPAEAGKMTCVQCRLCLDTAALRRRGLGIAFAIHGPQTEKARTHLRVIRDSGTHQKPLDWGKA